MGIGIKKNNKIISKIYFYRKKYNKINEKRYFKKQDNIQKI